MTQPHSSVRWPAEWEPQDALWLSWPHNRETWPGLYEPVPKAFANLARQIALATPVRVLAGSAVAAEADQVLRGISNLELVDVETNDCWIRDYGPTFVHAAGGSSDAIPQLEGLDLMPLFRGGQKLEREALFWHQPHNRNGIEWDMGSVILSNDWKLYQSLGVNPDRLVHLKSDPMEKINRIEGNPEEAARLRKQLNEWLERVDARMPIP